MQNRICKYLRHPQEAYRIDVANLGLPPERADPLAIDLCAWLLETYAEELPPPLRRNASGISLTDGDCDRCPCFEPVECPALPSKEIRR